MIFKVGNVYPVMRLENGKISSYSFYKLEKIKDKTFIMTNADYTYAPENEFDKSLVMPNIRLALYRIAADEHKNGKKVPEQKLKLAKKYFPELFL